MFGLTERAGRTYRTLLRNQRASLSDLAAATGVSASTVRRDLAALVQQGLVAADRAAPSGVRPARPDLVLGDLLAGEEAELADRAARLHAWRRDLAGLVDDYLAGRELLDSAVELERLDGLPAIRARMDELVAKTTREMLAVVTDFDDDPAAVDAARDEDLAVLARGVEIRTIYPTTIRDMPVTWAYAKETAAAGEQIRLSDEVTARMIVLDRSVAVIPADAENLDLGAVVVRSSPIVHTFVALFELAWRRAVPLFAGAAELTGPTRSLLDLLGAGAKDDTVARHLRRDVRTVRRDIARIMTELDAATRFQAGVEAARRAWL